MKELKIKALSQQFHLRIPSASFQMSQREKSHDGDRFSSLTPIEKSFPERLHGFSSASFNEITRFRTQIDITFGENRWRKGLNLF